MSTEPTLIAAMDCRELERSVDAFLDDEFEARERAEAEAHLAGCPRCRAAFEVQARVRADIREKLREAMASPSSGRAPAGLRERLERSLASERRPLWRRAMAPLPLATVAACAAGVLVVLASHSGNPDLLEDAVRKHHRGLPMEVNAAVVPDWFTGKLDFRPSLPRFTDTSARIEGARLSNLREYPAAYVRYQLPHGLAGLFIVDDPNRRFDAPGREVQLGADRVRVTRTRGYNVVFWRQDEIVYSLVSDLDEGSLVQLVREARHQTGGR